MQNPSGLYLESMLNQRIQNLNYLIQFGGEICQKETRKWEKLFKKLRGGEEGGATTLKN